MKWATHAACALILALRVGINPLLAWAAAAGALAPDAFELRYRRLVGHRSPLVHNFAVVAAALPLALPNPVALAFVFGYAHHLLLDAATRGGVKLFWLRVSGPLSTGNLLHNLAVFALHLAALVI